MKIVVGCDHRFFTTSDGRAWTRVGPGREFWQRYLSVFDGVVIVARAAHLADVPAGLRRVDGEGVTLSPVVDYSGPWRYALRARSVRQDILGALATGAALILRVPSNIGSRLASEARRQGRPYALEVCGDPHEALAGGCVHLPGRRLFQYIFTQRLRSECRHAAAVAYVTRHALQARYPSYGYQAAVSDVELAGDSFACDLQQMLDRQTASEKQRASTGDGGGPFRILFVGSLAQLYKGPDVLIDAFSEAVRSGLHANLTIVGDGRHRTELEELARQRGIAGRVTFAGEVPSGAPVREYLDAADLFVLPSRTEGLPRALIEAMARGVPAVASCVGGIPELLAAEDMVPPGNVSVLATKILDVAGAPDRRRLMSARNAAVAASFTDSNLREIRRRFYQRVRDLTLEWLNSTKTSRSVCSTCEFEIVSGPAAGDWRNENRS